jgi:hypothetical protein
VASFLPSRLTSKLTAEPPLTVKRIFALETGCLSFALFKTTVFKITPLALASPNKFIGSKLISFLISW